MSVSANDRTLIVVFGRPRPRIWLRSGEWTGFAIWRFMAVWGRTDIAAQLSKLLDGIGAAGSAEPEDGA